MKRDKGPNRPRMPKQTLGASPEAWDDAFKAQLRAVKSDLRNKLPLDAEKVAEIRRAIAEGRYMVDPAAISKRLLRALRGRGKTPKR